MPTSMSTRVRLQQKARAICLRYASDELRKDRKVVITAMLNHPGSLVYCLDEQLRAELSGLSKSQLNSLLETADEDMKPNIAPLEPLDDIHNCLMCFDHGGLCSSCASQGKTLSIKSNINESDSSFDLDLIEASLLNISDQDSNKKKKKKKKLLNQNHISSPNSSIQSHEEEEEENDDDESILQNIKQDENKSNETTNENTNESTNNESDAILESSRIQMDTTWPSIILNDYPEKSVELSRSWTIKHALDKLDINLDNLTRTRLEEHNNNNNNNHIKIRFLILGADGREGNNPRETLNVFQDLFNHFLLDHNLNKNLNIKLTLSLFGPNVSKHLNNKTFEFTSFNSIPFIGHSMLCIDYSNQLYHEVDQKIRDIPYNLSIGFNSGFWGYSDWLPTLEMVLAIGSPPMLLTSYSLSELDDDLDCIEEELPNTHKNLKYLWGPEENPLKSLMLRKCQAIEPNYENHSWICLQPLIEPPHLECKQEDELTRLRNKEDQGVEETSSGDPLTVSVTYSLHVAAVLCKYGVPKEKHLEFLKDLSS